jgi:GH25 family lysozyme M1 (1,4-beta-N-acetylmuramidase)
MASSQFDDFPDPPRESRTPVARRHPLGVVLPAVAVLAAASIAAADSLPDMALLGMQRPEKAAAATPRPSGPVGPRQAETVAQPLSDSSRQPHAPVASAPVTHPNDDFMGSTITANEGAPPSPPVPPPPSGATLQGLDVSNYQGAVNWGAVAAGGASFAYIKATEGTGFVDGQFAGNSAGSAAAGLAHGAYHFALPDRSSGASQANFFVNHGGGWVADGSTLPPVIDMEYNPYGPTCYGLSKGQMAAWVADFSNTVHARTGRWPAIYTTTNWWSTCTGNNAGFGADPLWIARYSSTPGALPAGWSFYSFWQYADGGVFPGDQDIFSGSADELHFFASNTGPVVLQNPVIAPPARPAPPPPPPPAPPAPPAPPIAPPPPPAPPAPPTSAPPTSTSPTTDPTSPPTSPGDPSTTPTSPPPSGSDPSAGATDPTTDPTSTPPSTGDQSTSTSDSTTTTNAPSWGRPS